MKRPLRIKIMHDDLDLYPDAIRSAYNEGRQDMIDFLPGRDELNKIICRCREHNSVNETLLLSALIQRLEVDDEEI